MKRLLVTAIGLVLGSVLLYAALRDRSLMHVLILVLLYAYWGVAWNLCAGFAGLVSLGHALFAGIGAYAVAYLYGAHDLNFWFGAGTGALVAALVAAGIGLLCFRFGVKGHYFGLFTLACAEVAFLCASGIEALGRSDGLSIDFLQWNAGQLQFRDKWPYALAVAALFAGVMVLSRLLLAGRTGYYWQALRDNEEAAAALGVPALRYKLLALVLSAALTAFGGAFYAQYMAFVDPRSVLSLDLSIQILVFCVVGGLRNLWGPLLGAALLIPLGEAVRLSFGASLPGAPLVVYALVLITVALALPRGLVSLRWPGQHA